MAAEREARCVLELEQARAGALRQTDAHEHGSAPGASASTDEGGGGFSEEGQVRSQERHVVRIARTIGEGPPRPTKDTSRWMIYPIMTPTLPLPLRQLVLPRALFSE
eukprot:TRINITY_DN1217_c0_g2_i7.p3 TRINITY_DN1217_c0_g2~~TRINITY_DN1217_c0_g2_i7.p3  ORF type:complete len:107 (+),score=1.87 TRINITY_DN1217_c0_g2_i7:342-662(+)